MNFVKQHGARVVVRGVRAVSDFDYEFQFGRMKPADVSESKPSL